MISTKENEMKEQSTEERIAFLKHAVEWRQNALEHARAQHATLQELIDTQRNLIDTLEFTLTVVTRRNKEEQ